VRSKPPGQAAQVGRWPGDDGLNNQPVSGAATQNRNLVGPRAQVLVDALIWPSAVPAELMRGIQTHVQICQYERDACSRIHSPYGWLCCAACSSGRKARQDLSLALKSAVNARTIAPFPVSAHVPEDSCAPRCPAPAHPAAHHGKSPPKPSRPIMASGFGNRPEVEIGARQRPLFATSFAARAVSGPELDHQPTCVVVVAAV